MTIHFRFLSLQCILYSIISVVYSLIFGEPMTSVGEAERSSALYQSSPDEYSPAATEGKREKGADLCRRPSFNTRHGVKLASGKPIGKQSYWRWWPRFLWHPSHPRQ